MRAQWIDSHYVASFGPGRPVLRMHWSLALGAVIFGGGTWGGAFGAFFLILAHELGHAVLVRARGMRATRIDMHGMGGSCHYDGRGASPVDRAIIAWGGVLAQAVILAGALAIHRFAPPAPGGFLANLVFVLIASNIAMIAINLLPFEPLDGSRAWRLFSLLASRRPSRSSTVRPPGRRPSPAVVVSLDERRCRREDHDDDDDPPERRVLH